MEAEMLYWIRIAGMSAVLAAGVVAYGDAGSAATPTGKAFTDRLPSFGEAATSVAGSPSGAQGKSDREARALSCATQTWPYFSADCLTRVGEAGPARQVRTITVETREAPNTSTLVRVPHTTVASR